ncbi:acyl-CoA dehydrogenase family protein [[Clostridium] polysaccharolyticum]|uniref:Acyl-CoA dehydrogenase n=1 Tax=[Clostridium] polysaccharolyticum TaxID=29364 RepID=A0A1I0E4L0_9FIRM|nr:acyl-CoA dehydrogenase family protein [[Clostridium] polysaccharolyticum]SET39813.1 hypothetical protein SAMN04487772_11846 [[Clostridium] polysaccharolyticum]
MESWKEKAKLFVDDNIIPIAQKIDQDAKIPEKLIEKLAKEGFLGINIKEENGGQGCTYADIARINEEFGRGCSSVRTILTVHGMVAAALERWGSKQCKEKYLRDLAEGKKIAAFCLTEPDAGSDTGSITSIAEKTEGGYIINAHKKWISMGQRADVYLVFCKVGKAPVAFLVDRKITSGIDIKPIDNLNCMRGGAIAELTFTDCFVPEENLLGGIGLGLTHVSLDSLLYGRFTIASGCVGAAQQCLDLSLKYSKKRKQFGQRLFQHELVKKLITEMVVDIHAARALCYEVGEKMDQKSQDAAINAFIAKYYCSKMIMRVIHNATQVYGANGLVSENTMERFARDMRAVEIIEGTSEIHEIILANNEIMRRV